MNHGYIYKPHEPHHRTFGAANQIGGTPLNPGGHWLPWAPLSDQQQNEGIEPENCTSEALLGCVEILARFQYGDTTEWSKRFLAYVSGTTTTGNDPMTVANALQSKGTVPESDWPNSTSLTTWDLFYVKPPQSLFVEAIEFIAEYAFDKEWVNSDPASLKAALEYSPLSVAGYAWALDPRDNTRYYTPPGAEPCHDFVLMDYVDGEYWVVFDSYEQDIKHLAWDYVFTDAMRYSLTKQIVNPTAWTQFLALIQGIVDSMQRALQIGDYAGYRTIGAERSPQWSKVRDAFIKANPQCAVCGSKKDLNAHHIKVFHLNQNDELDPQNLIALCRVHHQWWGHLGNWKSWNESVRDDSSVWADKISHRPI